MPDSAILVKPSRAAAQSSPKKTFCSRPRVQDKLCREWVDESHSFEDDSIAEVFAEDDRNLVQARTRPDLRIPVGELMLTHTAHCLHDNHRCKVKHRPRSR